MPELPVNNTSSDGVSYKQITHKQPKKDSKALLEGRPVYTGDMVPPVRSSSNSSAARMRAPRSAPSIRRAP